MINEGLRAGDLDGIVEKRFSVDQYKSKMGEDKDVMVLGFTCNSQAGAKDLESFAEKGYKNILDADATPGTMEDGKYKVFVEMPREENVCSKINEFLNDLKLLTNTDKFEFTYHKSDMPYEASLENLTNMLPKNENAYTEKLHQLRLGEVKMFFDKYNMLEFKLQKNILSVNKHNDPNTLQFELHSFGETQNILKESKAFKIDTNSMAESMYLTKFFGPYDITKTVENKFIFSHGGSSAVLSKHGW